MAKRKNLIFGLAVLALLLVVPLAWWMLLERPPLPPPPAATPPPELEVPPPPPAEARVVVPEAVDVVAVSGEVLVQRGESGSWQPLGAGEQLSTTDRIRTGKASEVRLRAADHTVTLVPHTELKVGELTAELSAFLLRRGMVRASAEGPRALRFGAAESDVQVEARQGRFDLATDGKGTVAVASTAGEVEVSARGEAVVLQPGFETLVRKGQAPTAPAPIPAELLLRVKWPTARRTNKRAITVEGRTRPAALVFLDGALVEVAEDGSFSQRLPLKEGRNQVQLEGMSVGGQAGTQRSPVIVVDTKGAKADFDTKELWE
ncbi:MAG: FecR domain-containing protein [Deltaproteobacteria bacterium]|nr:FecR domain-containing protein [Deltaproteobacteria bacterium]